MQLISLTIRNFRCCKEMQIDIGQMHAIVGGNGAGKSTILRALDLLFNPSTKKIDEESFYHKDSTLRIEIEAIFDQLTDEEKTKLGSYLRPDGSFQVMRSVKLDQGANAGTDIEDERDAKCKISAHYCKPVPIYDWLNASKISLAKITEWWRDKNTLTHNGVSFADTLGGTKPTVGAWKEKAEQFTTEHLNAGDFEDEWVDNPAGYPGVLKGALPHYELIPAVRDASDESKVTKSNPFGRLIYQIVETLDETLRAEVENTLKETTRRLNREGGADRALPVSKVENTIKGFLREMMPADLELEFQHPTVEVLLTTPKILIDDGFKGGIDGKGHGLQRVVIFAILRAYAKLLTEHPDRIKRNLILGVEEPELYMHPTAQRTVRRVLRAIADGGDQVLFTTHSALMVDVSYFDEIIRIEPPVLVNNQVPHGNTSNCHQLPVQAIIDDLAIRYPGTKGNVTVDSIRERSAHAYSVSRNEGFFAKSIILVEGATEVYSIPVYAKAMGHDLDALGVAVVECGGKNEIDRLYRIFNELGVTCYPLFDYDKNNTDADIKRTSRELLTLVGAPSETVPAAAIIHDRCSCFASKWEDDLKPEIENYEELASQAKKHFGLTNDSGKPLIARYVAQKVVSQNPPVVPPTIAAMIEKAVNASHHGSCLRK